MGAQVGVFSSYQMGLHNHLNDAQGGVLNDYSRFGAYRRPYRSGAPTLHNDNDAEVFDNTGLGLVPLKEFRVETAQVGQFRISWQARNADNVSDVYTQFFVNGLAVGIAQHMTANVYATKTHDYDVALAAGDLLQVWGDPGVDSVFVRNFRIYFDWRIEYFGDGSRNNLVTALPVSDVDLLDLTAVF